ncbi:hypothetical protein [Paraburkholderia franconis]|nr:hypothetical protein [Paraburkholderia franconis]
MTVNVSQYNGSGTAAAWSVAVAGAPGQSQKLTNVNAAVTASTTLAATYLYVPVAMTMFGQAVTLPDATTLSTGGPQYIFDNSKGTYPFGIRDNSGKLVMGVGAGGVVSVSLKDNSTVAGVWSVHGSNMEPGLVTIDTTLSSTYYGNAGIDTTSGVSLALNSNQSLHFAASAARTALYAYIVDNVGKQVTTPVLVGTVGSGPAVVGGVWSITATTAMLIYGDGQGNTYGVVLTISGTTITAGSPATIAGTTAGMYFSEYGYAAPRLAQLSPTLYLVTGCYGGSTASNAVAAFSVSGTTVTAGATAYIGAAYGVAPTIYALTATTALVIYTQASSQPYNVSAVVVSVSGTTCTVGTPVAPPGGGYVNTTYAQQPISCLLSPTTALVVTDNGGAGNAVLPFVVTISGTTVTWSAQSALETGVTGFNQCSAYTSNSGSRFAPHLMPLSATSAFLWYCDQGSNSRAVVLTVSGSTYAAGPILYDSISATSAIGLGTILPYSANEFLAVKQRASAASTYSPFLQPSKISGNVVSTGYGCPLSDFGPVTTSSIGCYRLSGGDYAIFSQSPATPVLAIFRNNGDAINSRGSVKIPPMALTAAYVWLAQNCAVASNRLVFIGSTAISGPAPSASGAQTRILSVEIAA